MSRSSEHRSPLKRSNELSNQPANQESIIRPRPLRAVGSKVGIIIYKGITVYEDESCTYSLLRKANDTKGTCIMNEDATDFNGVWPSCSLCSFLHVSQCVLFMTSCQGKIP